MSKDTAGGQVEGVSDVIESCTTIFCVAFSAVPTRFPSFLSKLFASLFKLRKRSSEAKTGYLSNGKVVSIHDDDDDDGTVLFGK